jgi:hypothetical protein
LPSSLIQGQGRIEKAPGEKEGQEREDRPKPEMRAFPGQGRGKDQQGGMRFWGGQGDNLSIILPSIASLFSICFQYNKNSRCTRKKTTCERNMI